MKLHTLKGYIQNIYMIEQPQGIVLLDGCSRADVEKVCKFIASLSRPLSDLKYIVVTHMHPDHAGGAHVLRQRTGAQVIAHPKASTWYRGLVGGVAHLIDIILTWYVAGKLARPRKNIWYSRVLKPDIVANDNSAIPGFDEFVIVHTPGHTDHDLSVVHKPSGYAYVADLIVKVKGQLTPPYPVCHPNQYRRSLQRIASMPLNKIYCAHVAPTPIADIDFDSVIAQAPTFPKNHWHSSKNRLLQKLGISSKNH